jgi:hypothetical protein
MLTAPIGKFHIDDICVHTQWPLVVEPCDAPPIYPPGSATYNNSNAKQDNMILIDVNPFTTKIVKILNACTTILQAMFVPPKEEV